jgi:hypothetical protein
MKYVSETGLLGCGIDDEMWDSENIDRRSEEMDFMKNCDDEWLEWFISTCQ